MTARPRLAVIDWMKTIGLALIVWVHVAGGTAQMWTPPFYAKQLGVAFFVFVTGYTLAHERRRGLWVVVHRYVEVFVWGAVIAVGVGVVGLVVRGRPDPSNFMPLAGGVHILVNNFPANPTTWYIGTYLHLLLLWALALRTRSIGWRLVVTVTLAEIVVRALAMQAFGLFIAYMLLVNWTGVLLLGLLFGRLRFDPPRWGPLLAAAFLFGWPLALRQIEWQQTFPFMTLADLPAATGAIVVSLLVSIAYLAYTAAAFTLLRRLRNYATVRLVARNTVVVFIGHMPLYYLLELLWLDAIPSYAVRVTLEFLVCFAGLALTAEVARRAIDPTRLRAWATARLVPAGSGRT